MNCLNSFRTEDKLKPREKICKNQDFCRTLMPTEKIKRLEFSQYMKSDSMPSIIYADIESIIRKIDGCAWNPEKSSTMKKGKEIPPEYSMPLIWGFYHRENKHDLLRRKDCMKRFCDSLKRHAKNIILFEKKKIITVSKRRTKIISRGKSMLYLWKRNTGKVC